MHRKLEIFACGITIFYHNIPKHKRWNSKAEVEFFFQTKSLIVVVVNAYKQAHCADMGLYLFVGKAAGDACCFC